MIFRKFLTFLSIPSNLLLVAPLLTLPAILNVRVLSFVAPNEEPKWAVLIAFAVFVACAAAWTLWKSRSRLPLSLTLPGAFLLLFFIWLFIGVFVAPNMIEGAIRFAFWFFAFFAWLIALWSCRSHSQWREWLAWSTAISGTIFSLGYWWSYAIDYKKAGYNIHVLFSPIGHVNFTGDVLIVLLPFLLWSLYSHANSILRVLNTLSVFTAITVLLVASSRGALGGLTLGILVLLVVASRHFINFKAFVQTTFKLNRASFIWLAVAISTAIITYYTLPYHYRELARVSGTLSAGTELSSPSNLTAAKQPPFADFWNSLRPVLHTRTGMYASSTAMALDSPVLGHGTGNFPFVYPQYSNTFPEFRDPLSSDRTFTTNPHNVVLQIATQNGLPAMVIFVGLLLYFWLRLIRHLWATWNSYLAAGLFCITAVIFDAMFNHVFYNPASMFVFALFGATWWAVLEENTPHRKIIQFAKTVPARAAAVLTVILILSLSVWPVRWIVSEWHVAYATAHPKQPTVVAKHFLDALDMDPYNFRALYGVAQVHYQKKELTKTVSLMQQMSQLYPGSVQAANLLGAAFLRMGDLKQAEQAFARALTLLPDYNDAQRNLLITHRAMQQQHRNLRR